METALLRLVYFLFFVHPPVWIDVTPGKFIANNKSPDYTIYSAILDRSCQSPPAQQHLYLISRTTEKPTVKDWKDVIRRYTPGGIGANPAWRQFITSVDSSQFAVRPLMDSIPARCFRTHVFTSQEWKDHLAPQAQSDIETLKNKFEGLSAVLGFSTVVYSTDSTKALCYESSICGNVCGYGYLHFLEKSLKGWEVVGSALLWIS